MSKHLLVLKSQLQCPSSLAPPGPVSLALFWVPMTFYSYLNYGTEQVVL